MSLSYHYPPEVLQLLTDAIPALCRSKRDLLVFFNGAGVPDRLLAPHAALLDRDGQRFKKHTVAEAVLYHLNRNDEAYIRERREILKRVAEWENFDSCWDSDRQKAIGLVSEIRRVIGVKDAFTRMSIEREREADARRASARSEIDARNERRAKLAALKSELSGLFGHRNAQARGVALEGVLNRLFGLYGMLVRESFERRSPEGGCLEQLDGVIEADSHLWLVEMKWHERRLGPEHVNNHVARVFGRGEVRALLVSASGYTDAAVDAARTANVHRLCVLMELQEVVECLEREVDLAEVVRRKTVAASIDKNPLHRALAHMV